MKKNGKKLPLDITFCFECHMEKLNKTELYSGNDMPFTTRLY